MIISGGAGQGQRHNLLWSYSPADQGVREAVGRGIELGIGQDSVITDHCEGIRAGRHLGLEQHRQRRIRHRDTGVIPGVDQLVPLGNRQHINPADRQVWIRDHRLKHPDKPISQHLDTGRLE